MQKVRYELDPYNRLILDRSGTKSGLPQFRTVLDGRFRTAEDNTLSYLVRAPLPEDERIPRQIRLKGEWSLTDDHELRLTLDAKGRETFGDQITLQGQILDVRDNALLFALTTTSKEHTRSTCVLNLSGRWRADGKNRLSFHVRKEEGLYDILTFNGAWEIDKNHQVIYRYEKVRLIRKKSRTHTLTFKGYWDIREKFRLSYVVNKSTGSVFDFTASAGIFQEGFIRCEMGITLARRAKPLERTITLFGTWRLKKGTGLIFEAEYEGGKTRAIVFGADARMTDQDTVSFRLRSGIANKDLGIEVGLSHSIAGRNGEAFVRMLKSKGEAALYAGAAWRW